MNAERRSIFSPQEINQIRGLFFSYSGIKIGIEKSVLIESRLRKRLFVTGLNSKQYIERVKADEAEREHFISQLTTHKTDWFRESVHFDFLKDHFASFGAAADDQQNLVKIWSAASSTGEEGYSIALTLLNENITNFRILGTDISQECLQKAAGRAYSLDVVKCQVPRPITDKFFQLNESAKLATIDGEMEMFFKWRQFNLVSSDLPSNDIRFDFIFLRNVLIYFSAEDSRKIVSRLLRYLSSEGYLILGLSETIANCRELNLERIENSIYKKSA